MSRSSSWFHEPPHAAPMTTTNTMKSVFCGDREPELKDHVFDLVSGRREEQARLYQDTVKHICLYIGKKLEGGKTLVRSIQNNFAVETFTPMVFPPTGNEIYDDKLADRTVQDLFDQQKQFIKNTETLWSLVLGQCTPCLQQRLQNMPSFLEAEPRSDGRVLLQIIQGIMMQDYDDAKEKNREYLMTLANHQFHDFHQTVDQTVQDFYEGYQSALADLFASGVMLPSPQGVTDGKELAAAEERLEAMYFLFKADRSRFQGLLDILDLLKSKGYDEYPKTMSDAVYELTDWAAKHPKTTQHVGPCDSVGPFFSTTSPCLPTPAVVSPEIKYRLTAAATAAAITSNRPLTRKGVGPLPLRLRQSCLEQARSRRQRNQQLQRQQLCTNTNITTTTTITTTSPNHAISIDSSSSTENGGIELDLEEIEEEELLREELLRDQMSIGSNNNANTLQVVDETENQLEEYLERERQYQGWIQEQIEMHDYETFKNSMVKLRNRTVRKSSFHVV